MGSSPRGFPRVFLFSKEVYNLIKLYTILKLGIDICILVWYSHDSKMCESNKIKEELS